MPKKSLIIADDHPIVGAGLKFILEKLNYSLTAEFTNGIECFNYILSNEPAIAIIDIKMPGMSGIEILEACKRKELSTKFIVVTMFMEESIYKKCMKEGALGFLPKAVMMEEVEACLHAVNKGKEYKNNRIKNTLIPAKKTEILNPFTPTQSKIILLMAENNNTYEIASSLFISNRTVDAHRNAISQKLGLNKSPSFKLADWVDENRDEILSSYNL